MAQQKLGFFFRIAIICLTIATAFAAPSHSPQRRVSCAAQVSVTKVIVVQPLYINTFVQQNTSFDVYKNHGITITNAPTTLDFVITGSATRYITGSRSMYSNSMYSNCRRAPRSLLTLV